MLETPPRVIAVRYRSETPEFGHPEMEPYV
jgi:hypothetical protein